MQLADLGHPVLGPQSYWKLTHGEIRVYSEGLRERANRKGGDTQARSTDGTQVAHRDGDGESAVMGADDYQTAGGSLKRANPETKRKRDLDALERADEKAREHYGDDYFDDD